MFSATVQAALYGLYVLAAIIVAVAGPFVIDTMPFWGGILAGLVVGLSLALIHEGLARRRAERRYARHLLALKRAFDQLRGEMEGGPPSGQPTPRPLPGADEFTMHQDERSEELPAASRRPASPRGASRPGWSDHFPAPGSGRSGSARAHYDDAPAPSGPADERELKVLEGLIEALYEEEERTPISGGRGSRADRARSDRNAPKDTRRRGEPFLDTNKAASGRGNLHVVSDGEGDGEEEAAVRPTVAPASLEEVRSALKENRVDLYLQPIVTLPQRRRRFHECFCYLRAEDGRVLPPDSYMAAAREAGLVTAVDNLLLFRCVQLLKAMREKDRDTAFFCNIAPHTLADRSFFRDFVEYMESHVELADNLVLEFSQADIVDNGPELVADLRRLGALGYRFSMDGTMDFDFDFDDFADNHFRTAKVRADTVLSELNGLGGAPDIRDIREGLGRRGVDLVVEDIDSEKTLLELLDYNIDFGQGYLFGEPRPAREPAAGAG